MKNSFFTLFFFILICTCKINAQYKVLFSNNYPPYNYQNNNGELIGFNIDILNAINNLYEDVDINYSSNNWQAINKALNNGKVEAIGGTHYPGSYDQSYLYTRSTINTSHCFFYNTKYFNKFSLEKFRTLKEPLVAMWKNDVLVHYVLSINPSAKFIYVNNYDDLIEKIERKDVTCLFGQRIGGMYYAKLAKKNYIKALNHRILERNMGFKVSNNSPELANIINNGLEVILANGTYEEIYNKWITEYDKSSFDYRNYLKYIIFITLLFLLLVGVNRFLQIQVRKKTKDLSHQIEVNAEIMQELEIQKFKAEESDRMKSAFLANMSHEIRTPMNGILGFTELLKTADYSSEKQTKFINIIQQSGNRMLNTINNIIDVSKLESGLEKPLIKKVNIREIVNELVDFFTAEATTKGLNLKLKEIGPKKDIIFYTDEYKINSILTNLIKNALKFTSEGYIQIEYTINNEYADFWVKDTGIGIPIENQTTIFEEFVQADFSHSSGFEGSGLGLSISKGYIYLLNGKIELKSEPNKGSTFYVRIPNSNKNESPITPPKSAGKLPKKTISTLKIIIAEDDSTTYYFLKELLKDVTETLHYAKDGIEAVELAKKHPETDLILMDIKMPHLNGFEATQKIRTFNKDVYIIGHTAFTQENYKRKVIDVGCNAYIAKPINRKKLFNLLQEIKVK
ncbi:Signal transduction histidine kinase [Lutibacter oricola]|uniref:histidine kinase n=1 Tax=Lutibacter oricola TaxID=762486 RepID=A0A1H2XYP0_9FLAO|nr:transporter substrate-binding domain-containing protein [Lutibacter oricola]SDW97976.1 Signal transduction histidine kinase [Lutibacter oricola]